MNRVNFSIWLTLFFILVSYSVRAELGEVDKFKLDVLNTVKIVGEQVEDYKHTHQLISTKQKQYAKQVRESTKIQQHFDNIYWNFQLSLGRFIDTGFWFYSTHNKPFLSLPLIEQGLIQSRNSLSTFQYLDYAIKKVNILSSVGKLSECAALAMEGKDMVDEDLAFVDIDSASHWNKLKLLSNQLRVFEIELSCQLAKQERKSWKENWQKIKELYNKNTYLKFYFPHYERGEAVLVGQLFESDSQKLAINTDLLIKLFEQFSRNREWKQALEVHELLSVWLEHNLVIETELSSKNLEKLKKLASDPTSLRLGADNNSTEVHAIDASSQFFGQAISSKITTGSYDSLFLNRIRYRQLAKYYKGYVDSIVLLHKNDMNEALVRANSLVDTSENIEQFYKKNMSTALFGQDKLVEKKITANEVLALIAEKMNLLDLAATKFLENIVWAEKNRSSIPVELRDYFFRSKLRNNYLGLYRVKVKIYQRDENEVNLLAVLEASERLRSRQLKDYLKISLEYNDSILKRIKDDELYYIISDLDDSLALIALSKSEADVRLINKPNNWQSSVSKLRKQVVSRETLEHDELMSMSDILLKPFMSKIKRFSKINLLIDGSLSSFPISILPDDAGAPIGVSKQISYLVSLDSKTNQLSSFENAKFLAIADPIFEYQMSNLALNESLSLPALPETRGEVVSIATKFTSNSTVLLGVNATKENFLRQLSLKPNVIHVATHGFLDGEIQYLNEPALAFTGNTEIDGFLTASEIKKLRIDSDLVVLSACNTGNGEYFYGESISGLGNAFALAGAKTLVVSLWPVDSVTTVNTMQSFYKHLLRGKSASESMNLAYKEIINSSMIELGITRGLTRARDEDKNINNFNYTIHPYYWSPFIVINL